MAYSPLLSRLTIDSEKADAVSMVVPNRASRRSGIALDCGGRLAGDKQQP
ncbi:hypothetical protein [Sphingomonas sp.]